MSKVGGVGDLGKEISCVLQLNVVVVVMMVARSKEFDPSIIYCVVAGVCPARCTVLTAIRDALPSRRLQRCPADAKWAVFRHRRPTHTTWECGGGRFGSEPV